METTLQMQARPLVNFDSAHDATLPQTRIYPLQAGVHKDIRLPWVCAHFCDDIAAVNEAC